MTEPDIAHVVKEILGSCVSSTKVILAQIRDVAVPSKIVIIFWDLKFNFLSPFRIVDVGFYVTKIFFITELETFSILKVIQNQHFIMDISSTIDTRWTQGSQPLIYLQQLVL